MASLADRCATKNRWVNDYLCYLGFFLRCFATFQRGGVMYVTVQIGRGSWLIGQPFLHINNFYDAAICVSRAFDCESTLHCKNAGSSRVKRVIYDYSNRLNHDQRANRSSLTAHWRRLLRNNRIGISAAFKIISG